MPVPNARADAGAPAPCGGCGFYLIHQRYCRHFVEFEGSEDGERTPPIGAEETLLHFEQWVEPWAGECFDCRAEMRYRGSILKADHHPACMVVVLHRLLVNGWLRERNEPAIEWPVETRWGDPVGVLTDDRDLEPRMWLWMCQGGNGDFYVATAPEGEKPIRQWVRIATSGGLSSRFPGFAPGIADAYRALHAATESKSAPKWPAVDPLVQS